MKKDFLKLFSAAAFTAVFAVTGCSKLTDIKPQGELDRSDMYRNVYDADAAIIGLYGKLTGLAGQYVVLNELRGDLMTVTANADDNLQQLNSHNVRSGNPYASPRPFYELIMNCNDVLRNFERMRDENKLTVEQFNHRYSDVGCLRSWLYLQLGIHFGEVPYVTEVLEDARSVTQQRFAKLPFESLLDSLIRFTEALPYRQQYPTGTSLNIAVDGWQTRTLFVPKLALLGDLNLWRGNYTKAGTFYRQLLDEGKNNPTLGSGMDNTYDYYKVKYAEVASNNDLAVGYVRYRENNAGSVIDNNTQGWRSMFGRGQDALWNSEWIWVMPFNKNFAPSNPFIDLFSVSGGGYKLTASKLATQNWNAQTQENSFPYDQRGRFTVRNIGGRPVIMKYLYNYLDGNTFVPTNPLEKGGQWFLYRATTVHLHLAEAATRDGYPRLGYALVNKGIKTTFDFDPANIDQTNKQATYYPAPYNFDARQGDFPRFRDEWHRHAGIRGRAYVRAVTLPGADSTTEVENMILDEAALELAYEGNRWPDLLRTALRRDDNNFLAEKIYQKLLADGDPQAATVRARLTNRKNWYLPFNWE